MHTKNILDLFKELFYIIYNRHSGDICAKYGRSRMNDAHTICLTDFVGLPAKIVWLLALFSNSESIFVRLLCRPPASQQHIVLGLELLLFTNLKQINSNYHY